MGVEVCVELQEGLKWGSVVTMGVACDLVDVCCCRQVTL